MIKWHVLSNRDSMLGERKALKNIGCWRVVRTSEGVKLINSRYVYKIKRDWTEKVTKRKSRLVASRYHQKQGVDYDETFAQVAKLTTFRLMLTLAQICNLSIHQLMLTAHSIMRHLIKMCLWIRHCTLILNPDIAEVTEESVWIEASTQRLSFTFCEVHQEPRICTKRIIKLPIHTA